LHLELYTLRGISRRMLAVYGCALGAWTVLAVLDVARREPILASFAMLELAPILGAYAAVSCGLAALTGAIAGTFAALARDGELAGAAACGVGPSVWLRPVALLALALVPWNSFMLSEVAPRARAAKRAEQKLLQRSPELCLRMLGAAPDFIDGCWVSFHPERGGRFSDLWLAELDGAGLPRAVWRAESGALSVPTERGAVRLDLTGARCWRRDARGAASVWTAERASVERSAPELRLPPRDVASDRPFELAGSELATRAALATEGKDARRVRAEIAGRLALTFAPIALAIAAVALGLTAARAGPWTASVAGVAWVGVVYLPLHAACAREVVGGASPWVLAIPNVAMLALALARWRPWRAV
jgi:lipopolysaccharide export LptBFGC system permease protein LptF